jgi:iron complex transport system ATP-binding protein
VFKLNSKSIIALRNVWMTRNSKTILRDISISVDEGEHWALLGANGSGKTSLLKIVTGYEWPTSGEVEVLGSRYGECNLPELRKHIGWVSSSLEHQLPGEDSALEIAMSGVDASMGLYREFGQEERTRAMQCLERLGVGHLQGQRYARLSQGEQQRVLIARAMASEPALLVLDEPCAGLDPAARQSFLRDLRVFAENRAAPSCIFVTHHIEEIGPWIDNAMVLKDGAVLSLGNVGSVLTSSVLSTAFGTPCSVYKENGMYRLAMSAV